MQLLEDKNTIDSGDMAERIAVLRKKVQQLLKNESNTDNTAVSSKYNDDLIEEIRVLKIELEKKGTTTDSKEFKNVSLENEILKKQLENSGSKVDNTLVEKLQAEKAELLEQLETILAESKEKTGASDDELLQENIMLKKQIANRDKTIKELDFKLEMFKLAKSLREGAGISTKSEELKKIITEYIKEIDTSIASLNIE